MSAPAALPGCESAASKRWSRFAVQLRDPLITLAIGAAVGGLLVLEDPHASIALTLTLSSGTGLLILLIARLLFSLLERPISRLGKGAGMAVRTMVLAASGLTAYLVMQEAAVHVLHVGMVGPHQFIYVTMTAALAVTFGLAFYSFGVARSRLEASVARLKEVEFAEKELLLARELQGRLLPPPEIAGEGYRVAARNLPARLVAGDFYDSFLLPDGAVGVAVGDVAGKGMAAALIMASVKAMLPLVAAERSAAATLREVNRRLAAELPGREFVALALARFDPAGGRLELANAGLPDPYLLAPGQPPAPLVVPGPRLPLGVRHDVEYRSLGLCLAPGERVLLFTDGLAEAPAAGGEPLGYGALAALLAADGSGGQGGGDGEGAGGGRDGHDAHDDDVRESPLAWIDRLLERVRGATQPLLEDDWTALVLERGPAAEGSSTPAVAAPGNS
jgi:Stage II sporulation protein E (SpoIIE)